MEKPYLRQTVLIVDDAPDNIQLLGEELAADYDLLVSTNGEDALGIAFSESPPDLILLDIVMPGMDGYDVCKRLKAEEATRHIPVIFLTARRNEADEQMGLSLGAVDYITKPFSLAIVKARVKNHLELKRRGDMLEAMSARDPLTGLANRGRLDQVLQLEWRRCLRTARPLSLIMSDIDHFKAYNDNLGHAAGDECIKAVARALDAAMRRPADLVARYGGEEFTAILPDTESHGAGVVATAMKETVESLAISHPNSPISDRVTVSCGVAIATPASHLTPEDLLNAGDEMLYRAKDKGRNRVETVLL